MKLSELIARLEWIKDHEGDLEVRSIKSSQQAPSADVWYISKNGKRYWNWQEGEENKGARVVAV